MCSVQVYFLMNLFMSAFWNAKDMIIGFHVIGTFWNDISLELLIKEALVMASKTA